MADALLEAALVEELRERHGCHSVILYGSRARGDATPESDVDVLGVRDEGAATRDARLWRGVWLDAFVHPAADLGAVDASWLKLRGGRVLVERGEIATRLLAAVDALYAGGPRALDASERAVIHAWQKKTLARIARGDLEGDYRRVTLLYQALEDYFALRTRWYLGSKASFAWMRENDPATLAAFERALAVGAGVEAIGELVERVLGEPQGRS